MKSEEQRKKYETALRSFNEEAEKSKQGERAGLAFRVRHDPFAFQRDEHTPIPIIQGQHLRASQVQQA